jgi:hypothetical protein
MRRKPIEDDELYDPRYPRHMEVVRDGGRVSVPLMLSDSASGLVQRSPVMDARMRQHQSLLDHYSRVGASALRGSAHRPHCLISDSAEARIARAGAEQARDGWIAGLTDAWRNPVGPTVPRRGDDFEDIPPGSRSDFSSDVDNARLRQPGIDPDADDDGDDAERAYEERNRYLESAWKQGAQGPWARSVWAAQSAVKSGAPDNAARVEALRRRTTYERRDTMSDAEARQDRDQACDEMVNRLQNACAGRRVEGARKGPGPAGRTRPGFSRAGSACR